MLSVGGDVQQSTSDFLTGGGEVGALMRAHDWSTSPLGAPETWPQSLRSVVGLLLSSKFPMFVAWGDDLGFLYNEPYADILGAKHPNALGRRFQEIWTEIWPDISPLIEAALAGEATYRENLPLLMNRRGFDEQTWFTFSYSPLRNESGQLAGLLCACTETTQAVVAEQRQAFLLQLERQLRDAEPRDAMGAAVEAIARHLGASRVGYSEVQDDLETIHCATCFAEGVEPILGSFSLDDFGPESIKRQRRGETEICDDVATDPAQVHATWAGIDTRAFVSVPLVRDGRFRASLYVNFREPHRWSTEEVGLIEEVAARTWDAVERGRSEGSLRESEAQFRLMADAVPSVVWVTDADGRAEFFNRQWFDYTGAERKPTSATQVSDDHLHPDDAVPTMLAFNEERRSGTTYLIEHRIRSKAGEYRWFLVRGEPFRDLHTGKIAKWYGASVDIHDRKVAAEALRESEEQLRLATEAAEVGLWDLDVATNTLFWPPRVKAMFGISAGAPVSMTDYYDGLHPEDRERTATAFAAALDTGKRALYDVEYRTIGKEDGLTRWVAAKGRGIFDEAGRCVRVLGTAIDITSRRRTEIALRESEARVRALTDNLPAGMVYQVVTGAEGERRFLYVSQSHEKLTGVPAQDVLADPMVAYDLILPEDRERLVAAEAEAIRTMTPFDVEARFRHADGEVRWSRIISAPRKQSNGATIWDGLQIDTTGQKQAEAALRELNETLEARVAERTAELEQAHDQLRQSQKLEAMGQLTGGVSHDFNNLLSPIIGSLDLLQRKGVGSDRERRLIDGALQSAERARVLVQRLLAFARRQPLQPKPVDVGALVSGMSDLVASTTGPQVKVVVDIAEGLPAAIADPNQIEMAILNLSVNARDAMEGGGTLRISAAGVAVSPGHRTRLEPGNYVRLSVVDTGAGMDAAVLARAIEPFFSTKGVGRGTGLGLSMVHGLAEQLGGTLTIDSQVGLGTNVQIWLPASDAAFDEGRAPEDPAILPSAVGTALLVDDEDLVRASTADMLSDLGYSVVEAGSGEEAMRLVDGGLQPDVIVTDHLMPGMNGTELARVLRGRRPQARVLVISGYAEIEGLGADLARLVKPFRQAELAAKLADSHEA